MKWWLCIIALLFVTSCKKRSVSNVQNKSDVVSQPAFEFENADIMDLQYINLGKYNFNKYDPRHFIVASGNTLDSIALRLFRWDNDSNGLSLVKETELYHGDRRESINTIKISPKGDYLAVGYGKGAVLWKFGNHKEEALKILSKEEYNGESVSQIAFSDSYTDSTKFMVLAYDIDSRLEYIDLVNDPRKLNKFTNPKNETVNEVERNITETTSPILSMAWFEHEEVSGFYVVEENRSVVYYLATNPDFTTQPRFHVFLDKSVSTKKLIASHNIDTKMFTIYDNIGSSRGATAETFQGVKFYFNDYLTSSVSRFTAKGKVTYLMAGPRLNLIEGFYNIFEKQMSILMNLRRPVFTVSQKIEDLASLNGVESRQAFSYLIAITGGINFDNRKSYDKPVIKLLRLTHRLYDRNQNVKKENRYTLPWERDIELSCGYCDVIWFGFHPIDETKYMYFTNTGQIFTGNIHDQ